MGIPAKVSAHLRRAKSKAGPVPGAARRNETSALAPRLISYGASGALRSPTIPSQISLDEKAQIARLFIRRPC